MRDWSYRWQTGIFWWKTWAWKFQPASLIFKQSQSAWG